MSTLVERYADRVLGVLSCYDRVIVRGGIRGFDYAQAMESYLREKALDLASRLGASGDRGPDVAALREAIAAGRRGSGAGDAATAP
jgi:hypothetical protein